MSKIPLHGKHGQGYYAIVDDDNLEWLSQYTWNLSRPFPDGYATARVDGKQIRMHRLVLGEDNIPKYYVLGEDNVPRYHVVDHINHNRLDNRRANLRSVAVAENIRNSKRFLSP